MRKFIDINLQFVQKEMLGENGTRKGERTKKVPKYMQYDDADYGIFPTARTAQQKEKQATSAQNAQIARLFQKFITSVNQKLHDYDQQQQADRLLGNVHNGGQCEGNRGQSLQSIENAAQKSLGVTQGTSKRAREAGQQKAVKGEGKKAGGTSISKSAVSSSLQVDQDYNGMLNQHIRNSYPNVSSVSPDMLRGIDAQKQQAQHSKSKGKEDKKGTFGGKNGKTKEGRDDLKPFKRQSYHVAIAYHIHLKKVKASNPPSLDIDPTSPARRLRQAQPKQ